MLQYSRMNSRLSPGMTTSMVPVPASSNACSALQKADGACGCTRARSERIAVARSAYEPSQRREDNRSRARAAVEFADELADEVGEVVAGGDPGQQRGVFVMLRGPADVVHVGRVVEVAHLAPALVVDLLPLGGPVEAELEEVVVACMGCILPSKRGD